MKEVLGESKPRQIRQLATGVLGKNAIT